MSRDARFEASLKKLRKGLERSIDFRTQDICRKASAGIAQTFAEVSTKRLVEGATPLDSASSSKVNNIANSITHFQEGNRAVAFVPIDEEGLTLFLEYGTGLVGENSNNKLIETSKKRSDADRVGWEYAINRDKYKTLPSNGKVGWFFTKKPDSYIDANDTVIERKDKKLVLSTEIIQPTIRNGVRVKGYTRTMRRWKSKKNSVFTEGLKPIRFFGRTRSDIKAILTEAKSGGLKGKASVEDMEALLNNYRIKNGLGPIKII